MSNLNGLIKKLRDIMRNDPGINGDAQRIEQIVWMLFLKVYDAKPLTRRERAENVRKRDFLHKYSGAAREVLEILLDKYMNLGIREVEETAVLKMDEFRKYGTPTAIANHFGGKEGFKAALKSLEEEIYKAG